MSTSVDVNINENIIFSWDALQCVVVDETRTLFCSTEWFLSSLSKLSSPSPTRNSAAEQWNRPMWDIFILAVFAKSRIAGGHSALFWLKRQPQDALRPNSPPRRLTSIVDNSTSSAARMSSSSVPFETVVMIMDMHLSTSQARSRAQHRPCVAAGSWEKIAQIHPGK